MRRLIVAMVCLLNSAIGSAQESARLRIEVRSEAGPVRDADVVVTETPRKRTPAAPRRSSCCREDTSEARAEVPLTPRHSVGLDGAWEFGNAWRLGVEWYYTGPQRLVANPYREESVPYSVFGVLASRRLGRALLFINGENLTDVKQTDWDPLLRPSRGIDGRWTDDAWAPLGGRVINGWCANHVLRAETTSPYRFLESL
jgi:outer membrane receptor for ferrienterochelin and colicins